MRVCEIPGCGRPHLARGMCNAHYLQWWSTTTDLDKKPCTVEECQRPHASHGYCGNHAKNWRRHGDPVAPDRSGVNHPSWKANHEVGYTGAHHRVRNALGSPSAWPCADCGSLPAREWAYDHLDTNERQFTSRKGVIRFSTNPAHYMPLCKRCHAQFDHRHQVLLATNRGSQIR